MAGGPSQKENPRNTYAARLCATRDARPRQLPTDTNHAAPTRECQSDPPSLLRDARHPTLATHSPNPRRALTFHSMSGVRPEQVVQAVDGCLSPDGLVSSSMVVGPEPSVKGGGALSA